MPVFTLVGLPSHSLKVHTNINHPAAMVVGSSLLTVSDTVNSANTLLFLVCAFAIYIDAFIIGCYFVFCSD